MMNLLERFLTVVAFLGLYVIGCAIISAFFGSLSLIGYVLWGIIELGMFKSLYS